MYLSFLLRKILEESLPKWILDVILHMKVLIVHDEIDYK